MSLKHHLVQRILLHCQPRQSHVYSLRSDSLDCADGVGVDRDKRENMAEGAVSMIKHFQGVALKQQQSGSGS